MPPKSKRQNHDDDADKPFQAIVLADSYNNRFNPLSHETPRCLLPLCNIPIIEYTLEVLAVSSDVEDVFIVCTSHVEQIADYFQVDLQSDTKTVKHPKWSKPGCKLKLHLIQAPDAMSVGDALREIDAMQLIDTDFILTTGFLVSNVRLDEAFKRHREYRRKDKEALMTMVLKEASRVHSCRSQDCSSVFVLDPATEQCLHYQPVTALPRQKTIEADSTVFEKRSVVEFRNDLIDPLVDICSPEVLALATENFDWQQLRRDFVHGILISDILSKTIYTHIVSEPYMAVIRNEQLYSAVSKHILNRWVFPIVPDTNLMEDDNYELKRGNVYKAGGVNLSRSCQIKEAVQIGADTIIGEHSRVSNSVIGRRCRVGNNVTLEGVILFDDVCIGDNCEVTNSVLANRVNIQKDTIVERGCLISSDVKLEAGVLLEKYSRLSLHKQPEVNSFSFDGDEENDEGNEKVRTLPSERGPIYFWSEKVDDDDEDIRNISMVSLSYDLADLSLESDDASDSASEVGDASDDDFEDDLNGASLTARHSRKSEEFITEVRDTVTRAIASDHTLDDARLEIFNLRLTYDCEFADIREAIVPVLIDHILSPPSAAERKQRYKRWCHLIKNFSQRQDDQVHVLVILHKHMASQDKFHDDFVSTLSEFYDKDVIEEEAFLTWFYSDISKGETPEEKQLRKRSVQFAKWLAEAEEESEEDD